MTKRELIIQGRVDWMVSWGIAASVARKLVTAAYDMPRIRSPKCWCCDDTGTRHDTGEACSCKEAAK